jgi:integrase
MKTKKNSKIIEDYLTKYYRNIKTKKAIRWFLWEYFELIKKNPDTYFKKYNSKDLENHLFKFLELIEGRPPRTQSNLFSTVKNYFERNDVEIKRSTWDALRNRNNLGRSRPLTKKATPTIDGLKKILSYADLKQKTLFLFCATSGLRIDEAVRITFDDIDMEQRKVHVRPEIAKGGYERYTFFTPEMKELFGEWKKARLKLLQVRHVKSLYVRKMLENQGYQIKKEKEGKVINKDGGEVWRYRYNVFKDDRQLSKDELLNLDNRIFPFTEKNAIAIWTSLIERAGDPFNQRDKNPKFKKPRYMYNQHSLRRFWFTQISSSRMNPEYFNFIGGHMSELGSLYIRYLDNPIWIDKIKQEYDEHIDCLLVYETKPDLSDVHKELAEKDKQIQDLKNMMDEMKAQILELRLEKLEKANGIKNSRK